MKQFNLAPSLAKCPIYWQNFITDLQDRTNHFDRDVATPIIQRELRPYGARYHFAGPSPWGYIEFDREEQFTLFVLRWS
jgi:hypothetical protein